VLIIIKKKLFEIIIFTTLFFTIIFKN